MLRLTIAAIICNVSMHTINNIGNGIFYEFSALRKCKIVFNIGYCVGYTQIINYHNIGRINIYCESRRPVVFVGFFRDARGWYRSKGTHRGWRHIPIRSRLSRSRACVHVFFFFYKSPAVNKPRARYYISAVIFCSLHATYHHMM